VHAIDSTLYAGARSFGIPTLGAFLIAILQIAPKVPDQFANLRIGGEAEADRLAALGAILSIGL
jgi:hypothetical protein